MNKTATRQSSERVLTVTVDDGNGGIKVATVIVTIIPAPVAPEQIFFYLPIVQTQ